MCGDPGKGADRMVTQPPPLAPSADPSGSGPLGPGASSGWGLRLKIGLGGLGCLLLAAGYASLEFWQAPLPGMGRLEMARLMEMEVLVIFTFPFLALIALLRPSAPGWKVLQWSAFWTLLGLFFHGAWLSHRWWGVLAFAGLALATYLGFLLHLTGGAQILRLILRWLVSFIALIVLMGAMRMPEPANTWHQSPEVFRFGFLYFLTLCLVEWTGVYHGGWIERIVTSIRRNSRDTIVK